MTWLELAGWVYAIGVFAVGLGYIGYFRAHDETPTDTIGRAGFVALLWPLWAVLLIGLVLGL